MGMIPQGTIDQILDRVDIVEVVSDHIQLKKSGRNFKARCPFHNEKTPSFMVSPDKQIYHCFGCGAGGNVIGFVMNYEKMSFPEAVESLARRAGVELPKYEKRSEEEDSLITRLYEINKIAASFYQNKLRSPEGKKALGYLKKRGLNPNTINDFRIGYAPDEWESFQQYSTGKKIPPELLRKAGLSIKSDKGRGDYDRFRNRIIFPIFNERGNIVAFGARVLDDSLPKYINSPETAIYNKSNVLYGLNFSRKTIREKGYVLIVEGYMDVIVPFQYGITNTVAASGTALTPRQASMLKKYTDTAVMVFDSDQAGEAASLRGLDVLVANDVNVRIVTLPKGEDPDSFVKKHGVKGFEDIIKKAKDLFDYKLDLLMERFEGKEIRDKANIVSEMFPTISIVNNEIVKSGYLKKLAERLGVHEGSLRNEMKKVKPDYSFKVESSGKTDTGTRSYISSELHVLGLAILDGRLFELLKEELGLYMFRDESIKKVMGLVEDLYRQEGSTSPGKLLGRLEGDESAKVAVVQAVARADITEDRERVLRDCMECMRRENMADELKDLTLQLKKAQETKNDAEMRKLLTRINMIHKEKVGN